MPQYLKHIQYQLQKIFDTDKTDLVAWMKGIFDTLSRLPSTFANASHVKIDH